MNIFLLRHAQTEANLKGELSSQIDDPLTSDGLKQANAIVDELKALNIEKILCSPYQRAIDTIIPFSSAGNINIEIAPSLAEGQLVLEHDIAPEAAIYNSLGHPFENEPKGQFLWRAIETMEYIKSLNQSRVLVVSHGHMIRELLNIILRAPQKVRFPHDNCGLTSVSLASNPTLNFVNHVLGYNGLRHIT